LGVVLKEIAVDDDTTRQAAGKIMSAQEIYKRIKHDHPMLRIVSADDRMISYSQSFERQFLTGGGTIYGAAAAYEIVALETQRVSVSPRVGEQRVFSSASVSRAEVREPQHTEDAQTLRDVKGQSDLGF